ncbi:MAG: SDR family oxidoreductase [Phycisphaerales bacterium]|nr:SDR family oxidoreductase [Phycisphaerales bacterium]
MARSNVAIVTGAGSGIGRSVALMLAREGYALVLVGRDVGRLEGVAGEIRAGSATASAVEAHAVPADLSAPEGNEAMVAAALERFGRLDVLVNNAGWSPLAPIVETDPATARRIFEINALAPVWATRAAWGALTDAKAAATRVRSACIVNVSSVASVDPFPGLGVYGAAKAAVNTLTRATAAEGASAGLRAFSVAPGAVETPLLRSLFDEQAVPRERCLKPEDVAGVVVDCVLGAYDGRSGETVMVPSP